MKWFKHFSGAHSDDKIVSIRGEFGIWGVGAYWTLLERVAEQMKDEDSPPTAHLIVSELCSFLGCKRNKLVSFLDHSQNIRGMNRELNGNVLIITIPKMRELADNYTKQAKRLRRHYVETSKQEVEVEVEVDKKKKEKTAPPTWQEVQELWNKKKYPIQEAEKFFAYYSSNGWKVGKNPMKNWRAAAGGWVMRSADFSRGKNATAREIIKMEAKRRPCEWGCGAMLTDQQIAVHPSVCPKFKQASPETIAEVRAGIDSLSKKMKIN